MKEPREISIRVTRTVRDGHRTYSLDGNFTPLPCGNLVEGRIREYFRKITEPPTESDGNFFRLIDRETHCSLHVSIFNRVYPPKKDGSRQNGVTRDIKFIDLRPTSVLYNHLMEKNPDGLDSMRKEYREIWAILSSFEDEEDSILVELNPPAQDS